MSDYRKDLIKKYEKKGVKFKNGKPLGMKQIYENDSELFMDLQNDFYTTRGTMDEGGVDVKKMMKKIKEMMKGSKK
jgi:hypothetical protein|tara:strand:- start:2686 stop:2913 length:228 start_codon:yes stop_codon:yes gene_type:complete